MIDDKAVKRPDLSRVWASSGDAGVTAIDAEKYLLGWVAEIPTYQHMNYLHNRMDTIQLALAERGFHAWGRDIKYTLGSLVWNDKDSFVYVSKVENPTQEPSNTSTHWAKSMCQLTVKQFTDIEKAINDHIDSKNNPHAVTADQAGTYTKPVIDQKVAASNELINDHKALKNNPHGVTAEQAGAVPKSGGFYTGQVIFNHEITNFGVNSLRHNASGFNLYKDNKRLGLNNSGLPVYFDGAKENNILFDSNFNEWRKNTESEYSVPAPDVHIPFISDLNMIEGFGCVEYSRPTPATYIDKSGVLRTAAIDEPRFEKEGLLIEGQSTNLLPYSNEFAKFDCTTAKEVVSGIELTRVTRSGVVDSYISAAYSAFVGSQAVVSFYLKKSEIPAGFSFYIDDANNYVGLDSAAVVVNDLGNDLVRVSRVATISVATLLHFRFSGGLGTTFVIGGMQIEALPFATSYIPTKGAAATRAADVCSINTNGNIPLLGALTVTANINGFRQNGDAYMRIFDMFNGNSGIWKQNQSYAMSETTAGYLYNQQDGMTVHQYKLQSDMLGIRAGMASGAMSPIRSTASALSVANKLVFFSHGQAIREGFGHIRNFRIWHKALTDKQISTLS